MVFVSTVGTMCTAAFSATLGPQEPKPLGLSRDATSTATPPCVSTLGEGPFASASQPGVGWGNAVCDKGGGVGECNALYPVSTICPHVGGVAVATLE